MLGAVPRPASLLLAFALAAAPGPSRATPEVLGPVLLSYGRDASNSQPAVVVDGSGRVHVMWCREPLAKGDTPRVGTLVHSVLEDGRWTSTNRIASTEGTDFWRIDRPQAGVSPEGRLHVVWGAQSGVWTAGAGASRAHRDGAWSKPRLAASVPSVRSVDFLLARDGSWHLVYATNGSDLGGDGSVGYARSLDGGRQWSPPHRLAGASDPATEVQAEPRIVEDPAGRLHVAWFTARAPRWLGDKVLYARSEDRGLTWSEPRELATMETEDFRIDSPLLAATSQHDLYLLFVCGTPASRCARTSTDGGSSWQPRESIFEGLEGKAGNEELQVDGAGTLHFVGQLRYPKGVYYMRKELGEAWDQPLLAIRQPGFEDAHQIGVALGPEGLYAVWERSARAEFADVTFARIGAQVAWVGGVRSHESPRRPLAAGLYFAVALGLVAVVFATLRRGA